MYKNGYINKFLYERRLAKGYDLKTAGKLLDISSFKLKMIEYGYLKVNKKYYQRFIDLYQLPQDFFETNSNLATALVPESTEIFDEESRRFYLKPWLKWTALGLTLGSMAAVGYGAYCIEKINIKPRDMWTDNFTTFHEEMIKKGTKKFSPTYLDNVYQIFDKYREEAIGDIVTTIDSYEKDVNASDTNFLAEIDYQGAILPKYPHLVKNAKLTFEVIVYNRRKLIYSSYLNPNKPNDISITRALIAIDDNGDYHLLPFQYKDTDGNYKFTQYNSDLYNEFKETFFYVVKFCFKNLDYILTANNLGYTKANDLVNDIQIISRDLIYHNRAGVGITATFSTLAILFLIVTSIAFHFYRRSRRKVIDGPQVKVANTITYNNSFKMWKGVKIKDFKYGPFLPELTLELVGLAFLLIFSISIFIFFHTFLESQQYTRISEFRKVGANLLQAGVTILFFLKFDKMRNKGNDSIIFSAIVMFLAGIALYIAEICIFRIIHNTSSLLNIILNVFNSIIPGNMFFTMGWYTLLYFLLFKTPKGLNKKKNRTAIFRSLSAIPTFFLIFSLLWQYWLKNIAGASYYINLLFFSKGVLLTIFIIAYLYGSFIYHNLILKKYGNKLTSEVYVNTNKYNLIKNSIASGVLAILLVVDIIVGQLVPNNVLQLGAGWPIAIILPLIFLYKAHIGKRNKAWSMSFTLLNALFFVGGYIAIAIKLLSYINVGEFIFIVA